MSGISLIRIYEFLKRQHFFDFEPVAESLSWLGQVHSRGWLYTSSCGEEILAVACAFRIPEWREEFIRRPPDREEGSLLYIAFFCSVSGNTSSALKMLRNYLRVNADITEVIYHKKKGWSGLGPLKKYPRNQVLADIFEAEGRRLRFFKKGRRMMIQPPTLVPVVETEAEESEAEWEEQDSYSFQV